MRLLHLLGVQLMLATKPQRICCWSAGSKAWVWGAVATILSLGEKVTRVPLSKITRTNQGAIPSAFTREPMSLSGFLAEQ